MKGRGYIGRGKAFPIGEEDGVGGCDTDRRGSAHRKDADGIGYLSVVRAA